MAKETEKITEVLATLKNPIIVGMNLALGFFLMSIVIGVILFIGSAILFGMLGYLY